MKKEMKGFTLVELVMVMVIIGMLAAIVIPQFSTQRDEAKIAATKANLETLRTAISLYYAQEGNWPGNMTGNVAGELLLSPSNKQYLTKIPNDGFLAGNTIVFASSGTGGWLWDAMNHIVLPNLPNNDLRYGNQVFSQY